MTIVDIARTILGQKRSELPSKLYHYTSQDGLLGIVNKRAIWMTDIRYLNDSQEFSYAVSLFESLISERQVKFPYNPYRNIRAMGGKSEDLEKVDDSKAYALHEIHELLSDSLQFLGRHYYIFSLSSKPDLLSQWRGYCPNGSGFSIGFDCREIKKIAKKIGMFFAPCIYKEADQIKILTSLLDKFLKKISDISDAREFADPEFDLLKAFMVIAPFIKMSFFSCIPQFLFQGHSPGVAPCDVFFSISG